MISLLWQNKTGKKKKKKGTAPRHTFFPGLGKFQIVCIIASFPCLTTLYRMIDYVHLVHKSGILRPTMCIWTHCKTAALHWTNQEGGEKKNTIYRYIYTCTSYGGQRLFTWWVYSLCTALLLSSAKCCSLEWFPLLSRATMQHREQLNGTGSINSLSKLTKLFSTNACSINRHKTVSLQRGFSLKFLPTVYRWTISIRQDSWKVLLVKKELKKSTRATKISATMTWTKVCPCTRLRNVEHDRCTKKTSALNGRSYRTRTLAGWKWWSVETWWAWLLQQLGWWWGKGVQKLKVNKIYAQADRASSHVIFGSSSLYKTHGSTPTMNANLLQLTNLSSIAFITCTEI